MKLKKILLFKPSFESDPTNESGTNKGIGDHGNRLDDNSLAISPDILKVAGLKSGDPVYVNGQYIGNADDKPGEPGRIDSYDPHNTVGKNCGGMVWGAIVSNHP